METSVHIVGTGTIGEPLIGIFTDFRHYFDIDEVTFHKNTPILEDRARINHLIDRGARLVTDDDRRATFDRGGLRPLHRHHRLHADRQSDEGGALPAPPAAQGLPRPGQ